MRDAEELFQEMKAELLDLFREGAHRLLAEEAFNELAVRVFRFQCVAVPAYGRFVERRGAGPREVERWEEIPFLPTQAFKSRALIAGGPEAEERVFRTSGTTRGRWARGEHHVRELALYRGSLLPTFRSFLLPEGESLPVLNLLPSPEEAPDSSLTYMMGTVLEELAGGRGGFFTDAQGGIRPGDLHRGLAEAEEKGGAVLVAGTAFAFVHWIERARREGWRFTLPAGSRIMETGGYKGRSTLLSRENLYQGLEWAFGVPRGRIVNEYGMTELLSQFYEPVLRGGFGEEGGGGERDGSPRGGRDPEDLGARYHRGPPWVRTLILDPLTLTPVDEGRTGILAHLDLANLGSVSAVLTEDLGRAVPGGFQLLGRSPGAEPRGCSLAMEDFLRSDGP